jgi:hypothetical protein
MTYIVCGDYFNLSFSEEHCGNVNIYDTGKDTYGSIF